MGDPRVPDLGYARDILFGLRFGLDLYANVRPIKALSDQQIADVAPAGTRRQVLPGAIVEQQEPRRIALLGQQVGQRPAGKKRQRTLRSAGSRGTK